MKFLSHDKIEDESEKSRSSGGSDCDDKNYQKRDLAFDKDLKILKTLTKDNAIKGQVQLDIERINWMNKPFKNGDDEEEDLTQ